MKRLKLTNLGKVLVTILLIVASVVVYINLGKVGEMTNVRSLQEFLGILGWLWLFTQPFVLSAIWEF